MIASPLWIMNFLFALRLENDRILRNDGTDLGLHRRFPLHDWNPRKS